MAAHVIEAGRRTQTERAEKRDGCLLPTVRALHDVGMKLADIAARLTELGIRRPRGGA